MGSQRAELTMYDGLEKVGEGTYGTVFKGFHKKTRQMVALKKISLDKDDEGVPSTCLREIALLKELEHTSIVKLYDVIYSMNRLFLVFEYIDRDLKALLDKMPGKRLPLNYVKSFVWQMLQALAYCHTRRVIHRDLKPQNLLVDNNGTIKLADFGLARSFSIPSRAYTHEVVTLWYRAPELLLGARVYTTALDMWSLGCIFVEMAAGRSPFPGDSEIDELFRIFRVLGTPTSTVWPGVENLPDFKLSFPKWRWNEEGIAKMMGPLCPDGQDLAMAMIVYEPSRRITAKMGVAHRFLRDGLLPLPSVAELLRNLDDLDPNISRYSSDGEAF